MKTMLVARILLALVGTVTAIGATYFTFFASVEEGRVSGAIDWLLAVVAFALAAGYVIAAVRLGHPTQNAVRFAFAVVGLHVVFNVVKLVGYEEMEAVTFFVADVLILVALTGGRRRLLRSDE